MAIVLSLSSGLFGLLVIALPRQPHSWQRYILKGVRRLMSDSRRLRECERRVMAPQLGQVIIVL
jgi:hypothetical protein